MERCRVDTIQPSGRVWAIHDDIGFQIHQNVIPRVSSSSHKCTYKITHRVWRDGGTNSITYTFPDSSSHSRANSTNLKPHARAYFSTHTNTHKYPDIDADNLVMGRLVAYYCPSVSVFPCLFP